MVLYVGEGSEREQFYLLLEGFHSLSPLPTSELGPSGADSQVGRFVFVLELCGSFQPTLL